MILRMAVLFLVSMFLFAATAPLQAQERANTILILDGSGSMWGQIDGINKIVIAREVVGNLLQDFPADENLGLTVYGHREKGNCADIETLVAPSTGTVAAIQSAVNAISPKGKTPMTDAVIAAAEALRFTEERATVILVSDGIETCHPDPCEAARILEQTGVDFTAHVVGFDVTDPAALAQMQCLASETGGTFTTASNADELTDALAAVTVEPEPVYVPQTVRLVAVLEPGGPEIQEAVDWLIQPVEGASITGAGPGYSVELASGGYELDGTRLSDNARANAGWDVTDLETDEGLRIEVVFPKPEPKLTEVTFVAKIGSEDGPVITDPVLWSVASDKGDGIEDVTGNPLVQELAQSSHVVTAYWTAQEVSVERQFIATASPREVLVVFEEPKQTATITAPAEAPAGATIEVGWNGPNLRNDYVGVGAVGAQNADQWKNFFYTKDGNPARLTMPIEPGPSVITYFLGDGRDAIGATEIMVTPLDVSVTAPAEAVAGSTIEIGWVGPDYQNDYIGIGKVGATGADLWENFTYTRDGQPLQLLVPPTPGDYEITYFAAQGRTPLATVPIKITDLVVSLTAPSEATAGATIEVAWDGPNYQNDYLGIGLVGAEGADRWENFTYTRDGNPAKLLMPVQPGDYQITYFTGQDRKPMASVPITVSELAVTLTAPAEAVAGSTVEIGWTGPDYPNDYVGIGPAGAEGAKQWQNYRFTRDGNPTQLVMPTEPGDYVISYFAGQDRAKLASANVTVTALSASLIAPSEAVAGSTIEIAWEGPNYQNDYVGIGVVGANGGNQWKNYSYTRDGSPIKLLIPTEPGDYEISYFTGQDRAKQATVSLRVTPVSASLTAPATAPAGSTIEVGWDGPDYDRDYIGIGKTGASGGNQWESYAYTQSGGPAQLRLPEAPGTYVIQYFVGQDRSSLASVPITLE